MAYDFLSVFPCCLWNVGYLCLLSLINLLTENVMDTSLVMTYAPNSFARTLVGIRRLAAMNMPIY